MAAERGEREQRTERLSELGPLPGGHHGLSREQILESQRERLLAGIAQEVASHGYRGTTITELVKVANVSTRDFYEHFESKEECFLAAFDAVCSHVEQLILANAAEQADWPHQFIAGLCAACEFFATEPDLARLCLVESVSATPRIAMRFREAVLACAPGLAAGRRELEDPESLSASTEDSLIGGIVFVATRRVIAGETAQLPDLLPDLVSFALSPYLGDARSKELATRIERR